MNNLLQSKSIIATCMLVLPALNNVSAQKKTEKTPNIIFVLADDLGYAELGCYGQQLIETPNIDNLAKNGVCFTQYYVGCPVSAPSRCILLTGKHSGHSYIRGNDEWGERGEVWNFAKAINDPNLEGQRPLPAGTFTMGKMFQNQGYKTACIGKWGLGAPLSEGAPNKLGFDLFFGYNCQRQAHTYYPKHLWRNTEKVWLDNELVEPGTLLDSTADPLNIESYAKYTLKQYSPDLMYDESVKFIEENSKNPFFLFFTTPIPHAAIQAPQRWVDYYVKKFGDEKPYLGKSGYFPHRYPHAGYAAMISYLDEQIGKMVQKLKDLGIYENTIIIITSDNGPTFNGGTDSPWFNSAKPFKSEFGWGKTSLHEGGVRVPLIVSWAGHIKGGRKSDLICYAPDFMPTFAELMKIKKPENIDGISILPEILGKKQKVKHEYIYWEYPEYGGQQAVRIGNWKAFRGKLNKEDSPIQLFDLSKDIQEQNDVAAQHPEIVAKIAEIMKKEHQEPEIERFKIKYIK